MDNLLSELIPLQHHVIVIWAFVIHLRLPNFLRSCDCHLQSFIPASSESQQGRLLPQDSLCFLGGWLKKVHEHPLWGNPFPFSNGNSRRAICQIDFAPSEVQPLCKAVLLWGWKDPWQKPTEVPNRLPTVHASRPSCENTLKDGWKKPFSPFRKNTFAGFLARRPANSVFLKAAWESQNNSCWAKQSHGWLTQQPSWLAIIMGCLHYSCMSRTIYWRTCSHILLTISFD